MTLDLSRLKDGTRNELSLSIANFTPGQGLEVPVNVAAGRGSAPVFVCIAGVHGDEAEGILALLDLWHAVDPSELTGRLVLVPVANPPAFAAGRRTSPVDGADLNRSFPGRDDGQPSQRLAWELLRVVVRPADLVFSLHSWYSSGLAESFIECPPPTGAAAQFAFQAACASGFATVRITDWPEGLLGRVAVGEGIPAIEGEIGGLGRSLPENRQSYCAHVRRLMGFLGMTAARAPAADPPRICSAQHVIAKQSGVLRLKAGMGATVSEAQELATILDLRGRPVAPVLAPVAGRVGAHRMHVSVQPGDNLFTIFQPKEVQPPEHSE
jgi:predicted deacylase